MMHLFDVKVTGKEVWFGLISGQHKPIIRNNTTYIIVTYERI